MESTHSDQAEGKSSLSEKDYEGLTLNLHPANDDDEETKPEGGEGVPELDIELLEYQRQRSTPKIVIQEFEDEDQVAQAKMQEAQRKNELFSQVLYP